MTFQVTELRKALAAVWRLAENGNIVQFGLEEHHNFMKNIATGKKNHDAQEGAIVCLEDGVREVGAD